MEVRLGCKDPKRAHDPETNPYQRGDGVFGNWMRSQRPTVYDGTCVTTVHYGMLRPLAHGTRLATDYPEAAKRRAKAAACEANNYDFMTWASSTRGGIGREAAAWFTTNFDAKMALASSDSERWRVSGERKRFLQVHSTIIARRNFAIFDHTTRAGKHCPLEAASQVRLREPQEKLSKAVHVLDITRVMLLVSPYEVSGVHWCKTTNACISDS